MNGNKIVHISDASMLALHALLFLVQHPERRVQTNEIAERLGTSEHHLAKVMQILVKKGYIASVKGPAGGYTLSIKPETLSIKAIFEAIDGTLHAEFCPFSISCNPNNCILGKDFQNLSKKMVQLLEKRTLKDMQDTGIFA